MKRVWTNDEMAVILLDKRGWVFNDRPEVKRVHKARCESVAAMLASKHPKYHSDNRDDTEEWLNRHHRGVWLNCGLCGGLQSAVSWK